MPVGFGVNRRIDRPSHIADAVVRAAHLRGVAHVGHLRAVVHASHVRAVVHASHVRAVVHAADLRAVLGTDHLRAILGVVLGGGDLDAIERAGSDGDGVHDSDARADTVGIHDAADTDLGAGEFCDE